MRGDGELRKRCNVNRERRGPEYRWDAGSEQTHLSKPGCPCIHSTNVAQLCGMPPSGKFYKEVKLKIQDSRAG